MPHFELQLFLSTDIYVEALYSNNEEHFDSFNAASRDYINKHKQTHTHTIDTNVSEFVSIPVKKKKQCVFHFDIITCPLDSSI